MVLYRTIVAASVAGSLALGGLADAHPRLVSTTPLANSAAPRLNRIQLKFSEKLIAPMTAADVTMLAMPAMHGMRSHAASKVTGFTKKIEPDGKTVTLARARPLPAGRYRVNWRAVSVDTHRIAGNFKFAVK